MVRTEERPSSSASGMGPTEVARTRHLLGEIMSILGPELGAQEEGENLGASAGILTAPPSGAAGGSRAGAARSATQGAQVPPELSGLSEMDLFAPGTVERIDERNARAVLEQYQLYAAEVSEVHPDYVRYVLDHYGNPMSHLRAGLPLRRGFRRSFLQVVTEACAGFRNMTVHSAADTSVVGHETWGLRVEVHTLHLAQEIVAFWRGEHFSRTRAYPTVTITNATEPPVVRSDVASAGSARSSVGEPGRGSAASTREGSLEGAACGCPPGFGGICGQRAAGGGSG